MRTTGRRRVSLALALTSLLAAGGVVVPSNPAHAAQGSVSGATLTWGVNTEVQVAPPFGGCNYLSAGRSEGTQATYAASAGNVAIVKDGATPTWASHCTFTGGKANQVFVFLNGTGTLNSTTGATTIQWTGTVSVNFYGGAAPFWFENPRLTVAANGTGKVTASVGGYATSRDNPTVKVLLPNVDNVVIATLRSTPSANKTGFTVTPRFAGVVYNATSGDTPQNRTTAGWGSWPASFVDFQSQTGLSSYWYTSGSGFDSRKPPSAIAVGYGAFASSPSAPGSPTAAAAKSSTAKATGSLVVTYRGPNDNGGSPVVGYLATCKSSNGGATQTAARAGAAAAPISVAKVATGKRYTCSVTAKNAIGTGLKSAASDPVVVGSPAPASNARAARTATRAIRVTFKIGANNGAAIQSQTATCTSSNGGAKRSAAHSGSSAAPITVAGVTKGKKYTCSVTAKNARGVGLESAPSNAVTP